MNGQEIINGEKYMEIDSRIEQYYKQIEFCYRNVEWSHKIHEKAADIYTTANTWMQWAQLVLSFLVSADVVAQLNSQNPIVNWYLVTCTLLLTLLNTITKTFDFAGRANKHVIAANSLWGLREDYRSLKNDILTGCYTIEQIRVKRDELQSSVQEVYKTAPRTFSKAYNAADKDFKNGKVTFDDLEEK